MLRSLDQTGFSLRRSFWSLLLLSASCVEPFDDTRKEDGEPLGEAVFGVVCDRVGAQSLREDITGESYQRVCHRDEDGRFADKVDDALLPRVTEARYHDGKPVPPEVLAEKRERGIARVEALADERDPLIEAFSAMLPDVQLMGRPSCASTVRLYDALTESLAELVPLYEDETVPAITRALGGLLDRIATDKDLATALARMNTREGYRPEDLALYVLRPLLSYPRLYDLGAALADVHRENRNGARDKLAAVFREAATSLRETARERPAPDVPLLTVMDEALAFPRINRPRTTREITLELLSEAARKDTQNLWIVKRDPRGLARVNMVNGVLPFPFSPGEGGLPKADDLGRFVTVDGSRAPLPFLVSPDREPDGRARTADGALLYEYLPIPGSVLFELATTVSPLFVPRADQGNEALLDALELLGPLLGRNRDAPEQGPYSAERAPLVSFVHALTVTLSRPELEDALALFEQITRERPEIVSRVVKLVLSLDAVADRYPDVKLPEKSTLWDELLEVVADFAHRPGLAEAVLRTFKTPETAEFGKVIASYMRFKDEITYYRDPNNPESFDSLNGPVFNLTTNDFGDMRTPVDRSQPDSGMNRSVLQRFLQLLHDANGLDACSKAGAVAHVDIIWNGLPVKLDYPTSPLAKVVCTFLGAPVVDPIPECGILRFDDVASLIIKVALNKYRVEVRDPCLARLMDSPLTGLVGGAQAFLEDISGIRGFGIEPTVQGVARLAFFDAPYAEWGGYAGDRYYPKTSRFLQDVMSPVPSMVCPVAITSDPASGEPIELRRCERFEDTLRGRDRNGLFPLEQLRFLEVVQPLANAFDDHDATPVFVKLLDTLHKHWGSDRQTRDECDPTLPKSHARWCSQDGVVYYEPMLVEMLTEGDLFGEIATIVELLEGTTVRHCDERDATGTCLRTSERDGVQVVAEALRGLFDPARTPGLTSHRGGTKAIWNDGTEGGPLTPGHLWLDAFNELRKSFDAKSRKVWLEARSHIVDRLLQVEERDGQPRFKLTALDTALPQALRLLRQQLLAHCPNVPDDFSCPWIDTSVKDLSEAIEHPLTEKLVATLDALRADEPSRREIGRMFAHLFGLEAGVHASTVAAALDLLQILDDDENLRPIAGLIADALDSEDANTENVLAPRVLDLLARFFAKEPGGGACQGVDPHHAFAYVLGQAVTPMGEREKAPLEVLIDAALRVNRVDPRLRTDLTPEDMQNVGREFSLLMLDPASGLEQLYTLLRQATGKAP